MMPFVEVDAMRLTITLLAVCVINGCAGAPIVAQLPESVTAACADMCYVTCDAAGIDFAPGADDPVGDLIEQVLIPLRGRIDRCEISRLACQQCIDRLKTVGAIR